MATTIQLNNGLLLASTLSAGSLATCSIVGLEIPENTTAYIIITDKLSGDAFAVSGVMNLANSFAANIDLLTDVIYEIYRKLLADSRRWVDIECIDTTNRLSLGHGHAVLANSALISGSTASIPELSTVLTTADFAAITDLARPAGLTSTADLLAAILNVLKGHNA